MKRNAGLCAIVLSSVILLYAQNDTTKDTAMDMTGWICTSPCVTQNTGHAACDSKCAGKDKHGEAVFIDDNGKVSKISNSDVVKGKMGKKVKAKCKMNKDNESMQILSIYG
jgi:hypothetical protein